MRETFVPKHFALGSLLIIQQANTILDEYQRQGLVLTLRQLYYQFVSRGLLENKLKEYKRLGSVISDARLAGKIDWRMMEDRTRNLRDLNKWGTPAEGLRDFQLRYYHEDLWRRQRHRPEVWIEKDALIGVIERVCQGLRVPYFACRGYSSQSAQYEAGKRFREWNRAGQEPIIFHFGDHDPSGIDMTRDNDERVNMFARGFVEVRRLALNMDQVEQYNPPPNPAKETDSRCAGYVERFGNESWELDALEPSVIGQLIRGAVEPLIDRDKWDEALAEEDLHKQQIATMADKWDDIHEYLDKRDRDEE